jgi:NitT/TauT family transport system ATP-binding protein
MSGKPYLSVTGLSIRFNGPEGWGHVLADLSFDVKQGELAAIIGPSGCGKSTLFNILAGLVKPDAGELCLDGRAVPNLKHRVAYMQQKDLLLPWRTVLDNAILGLEIKGMNKATARNQAMELMPVFGLAGSEQKRPAELSGGMRQRSGVASDHAVPQRRSPSGRAVRGAGRDHPAVHAGLVFGCLVPFPAHGFAGDA